MEKALDTALVWFRRDLRVADNAALYHALRSARQVWCAFVFDRAILDPLPRADRRVEFIVESVAALAADLAELGERVGRVGVRLLVRHGAGADEIVALAAELHAQAVFASHDDDPYALTRDARVRGALADRGVALHTSKDHVIFERSEVLTGSGKPYSVFTPYKTAWLAKVDDFFLKPYPVERHAASLAARTGGHRLRRADSRPGSASPGPTSVRSKSTAAASLPRRSSPTSCSASTTTAQHATTRRSRARATSARTCASARFRSEGSPPPRMRSPTARSDAVAAPAPAPRSGSSS